MDVVGMKFGKLEKPKNPDNVSSFRQIDSSSRLEF